MAIPRNMSPYPVIVNESKRIRVRAKAGLWCGRCCLPVTNGFTMVPRRSLRRLSQRDMKVSMKFCYMVAKGSRPSMYGRSEETKPRHKKHRTRYKKTGHTASVPQDLRGLPTLQCASVRTMGCGQLPSHWATPPTPSPSSHADIWSIGRIRMNPRATKNFGCLQRESFLDAVSGRHAPGTCISRGILPPALTILRPGPSPSCHLSRGLSIQLSAQMPLEISAPRPAAKFLRPVHTTSERLV